MKITKKWGGYMFFGGQTLLVHDTKWKGVVGPLRVSKFPLSDHGVHAKIVQTPPYMEDVLIQYVAHSIW